MLKQAIVPAFAFVALLAASPASANSTFPYTCSNTSFEYSASGQATMASTCLQANGMPHQTSLVLMGISNQNGHLTQGTGASTFQQSCVHRRRSPQPDSVVVQASAHRASGAAVPGSPVRFVVVFP